MTTFRSTKRLPAVLVAAAGALAVLAACTGTPPQKGTAAGASPAGAAAVAATEFVEASPQQRSSSGPLAQLDWRPFDPATSYLAGPHFGIALAGHATTDELGYDQLVQTGVALSHHPDGQALRAAPGQELLLVRTARAPYAHYPDAGTLTFTLVVGGDRRTFDAVLSGPGALLLASVPTGSTVLLTVDDSGRTQSIDLRTGAVGDVIALEHPQRGAKAQDLADLFPAGTPASKAADALALYSLDLTLALLPWVPEKGWAPAGQAWLEVVVQSLMLVGGELKLDLGKSLTLRTHTGRAVPLTGQLDIRFSAVGSGASLTQAVSVPAATRTVTASLATHGAILNDDGGPAAAAKIASSQSRATLTLAAAVTP